MSKTRRAVNVFAGVVVAMLAPLGLWVSGLDFRATGISAVYAALTIVATIFLLVAVCVEAFMYGE